MTPKELHEDCLEACLQCDPSYYNYDDDQNFGPEYGEFSKIPKKSMWKVVQFWREHGSPLWDKGYEAALSQEAQQIFADIDKVIEKAVKDYVRKLTT